MKLNLKTLLQSNKIFITIIVLIICIVIGVGFILKDRFSDEQSADITTAPPGSIIDTADAPILPDASVLFTEDGFFEERVDFSSPNDPVNATILIFNVSSSSASFTITTPDQTVVGPISLGQYQDEAYFAEKFGTYEVRNTITDQTMQVVLQKE